MAERGEGVIDGGGRSGFGEAVEDTVALEFFQAGSEDLGGDAFEIELQLGEAALAFAEEPDQVGGPGAGDEIHALAEGTFGGR